MSNAEPTLGEILEAMKSGFGSLEEGQRNIEGRVKVIEDEQPYARLSFMAIERSQKNIEGRLRVVEDGQRKISASIDDMREELEGALLANDNDGIAVLSHEKRITRIEKKDGIPVDRPMHLVKALGKA
jgi:chromosome segregation ATPase